MIFLLRKQFFEKIITEGGRELIVLNPFLDCLCNSTLKNTGLAPGIPKTCFQHPQDVVLLYTITTQESGARLREPGKTLAKMAI